MPSPAGIFLKGGKRKKLSGYSDIPRYKLVPAHAERLTLEMLRDAGVNYRLFSFACGVIMEDGCVKGVIAVSKADREAFAAHTVIDATGDGDVAATAGVPYFKGPEEDGEMQPMTTIFKVAGVDYKRAVFPGSFETLVPTDKGELQAWLQNCCLNLPDMYCYTARRSMVLLPVT